jgi:hypothetical protein
MDRYPVRVEAHRDESLSRWLWLVKWLLLIPHYLALLVLWTGLVILTLVAYLSVLVTGRYPASIRAYNTGVLRWTWRVGYYGYQALGTDRYPPFTLADDPGYPARLHIDAGQPERWLPLVAWLFAIPHVIILGALTGAANWSLDAGDGRAVAPLSVVGAAVLIAGLALLFTGDYPRGLHDLLVGVARWNLRVISGWFRLNSSSGTSSRLTRPGSSAASAQRPQEMCTPADPASSTASGVAAMAVTNIALVTTLPWNAVSVR